jgi:hypothetical protein
MDKSYRWNSAASIQAIFGWRLNLIYIVSALRADFEPQARRYSQIELPPVCDETFLF